MVAEKKTTLDGAPLLHGELTEAILGGFCQVHTELGYGYFESVYSAALALVLMELGLRVEREVPIAVHFRGIVVGSFRADMIVESKVVVELKAQRFLDPVCEVQLLNYLRATDLEVGLVLNFGPKATFKRRLATNDRKPSRSYSVDPANSATSAANRNQAGDRA